LRLTPDVFRSGRAFSGRPPLALRWLLGMTVPPPARHLYRRARSAWSSPQRVPDWLISSEAFRSEDNTFIWKPQSFFSAKQRMRWQTLLGAPLALYLLQKQRHSSLMGLEVVFPFLDWDLIQFVLAVPPKYWPRPGWLVRFQREALRRDLPPQIYRRRTKAEFASVMVHRVTRSLSQISDLCEGSTWMSGRFVEQREARQMLDAFRQASSPGLIAAYHLWAIASLEAWLRHVLSYATSPD
jgi:hypothetical protein